ncbi:hypothetical protein VCHA50P417_70215 [Vibrio chagasii]|nr:hypothetical protein VCHA35O142_30011 [Vibrio chagasii]CAH7234007.1 hypothetical protein VCHA48P442_20602 [Vibrio chagasii]CAH7392033.1 hypothetical protein VCHA50P417_70215 [Vibrio chagasii]
MAFFILSLGFKFTVVWLGSVVALLTTQRGVMTFKEIYEKRIT